MEMNKVADLFFIEGCGRCELHKTPECKVHNWAEELRLMREIVLSTELNEECKWGVPCYTINGKNVLTISALKNFASMGFFKGVLIEDKSKILTFPGENSQASKQYKCTDYKQLLKDEILLRDAIFQAIEIEKSGKKIDFKQKNELVYPQELLDKFAENEDLKFSFEALTPGRKRGYILHFTQAKQAETRVSRIQKLIPKILEGKGFYDR